MLQSTRRTIFQTMLGTLIVLAVLLCAALPVRAADYNCGAYGVGEYGENVCATTTDGDDGGSLVNTGQALSIAIPAGLILLGTIMLYRLRRRAKKPAR